MMADNPTPNNGRPTTGETCMRGRENTRLIVEARKDLDDLTGRCERSHEAQQEWNHNMDLRVSKLDWTLARNAGIVAAVVAVILSVAGQFVFFFATH